MQDKYYFTVQTNLLTVWARHVDKALSCLGSPLPVSPALVTSAFSLSEGPLVIFFNNQKANAIICAVEEAFRFQADQDEIHGFPWPC